LPEFIPNSYKATEKNPGLLLKANLLIILLKTVKNTLFFIFKAIGTKFGGYVQFDMLISNIFISRDKFDNWQLKAVIFHF